MTVYGANLAPPTHVTLQCDPAGGTVADPAAACAQLLADPDPFGPPPAHVLCPMILASGSRFVVYGTYLGRRVAATIREGGCELRPWAELHHVFG